MSNHAIGYAVNKVIRRSLTYYDENRITLEALKGIVRECDNVAGSMDGNSYEVFDGVSACRCGCCLKIIPKGEPLYAMDCLSDIVDYCYLDEIMDSVDALWHSLCDTCLRKALSLNEKVNVTAEECFAYLKEPESVKLGSAKSGETLVNQWSRPGAAPICLSPLGCH